MPILGLTDTTASFKEIGRLYKGMPKTQNAPGKDLEYFRAKFRPGEEKALKMWLANYKEKPTRINARLAFNEIVRSWDAFYEAYLGGGMIGRSDGEKWLYLRDPKTSKIVVNNGELTPYGEENGFSTAFDLSEPVHSWYSERTKKEYAVYAKPRGRLRFVVPELQVLGYMTLVTSSVNDIRSISAELAAIQLWAEGYGIPLTKIPLTVSRRPEQISIPKPDGSGRMHLEKWMVHVEPMQEWAEQALQFAMGESYALLKPPEIAYQLPETVTYEEIEEDYIEDDIPFDGEPEIDYPDQTADYNAHYGTDEPMPEQPQKPEDIPGVKRGMYSREDYYEQNFDANLSKVVDMVDSGTVIGYEQYWNAVKSLGFDQQEGIGFLNLKDEDDHPDFTGAIQRVIDFCLEGKGKDKKKKK